MLPAQPDRSDIERAWAFIKETKDQSQLEAFIKQFGDSVYAPMARARLEEFFVRKKAIARRAGKGVLWSISMDEMQ